MIALPGRRAFRVDPWSVAAVLPFAIVSLAYWDHIPLWDAREYADCIQEAARLGRFPRDYVCAGHPTLAYAAIASSLVSLVPAAQVAILVAHVAFGLLALLSFRGLAADLFPGHDRELSLLAAALGVFPVLLGATVAFNPDCAVTAFFLALLLCLSRRRFWLAALSGLLLVFSKETGVPLLVLAATLHALIVVTRGPGTPSEKGRALAGYLPLLLPLAAFAGWIAWRRQPGNAAFWGEQSAQSLFGVFTTFSLLDKQFLGHAMAACLFQFLWLATVAALVRWASKAKDWVFGLPSRDAPALRWLDALCLSSFLLLTRYRTYANLRYYLALAPLLLLCGYAAIASWPRWARFAGVGGLAMLFFVSAFRTVDPVARAAAGTFEFGSRSMLKMTSLGDWCCGYGRDQLAYNLEHTEFHFLQNEVYTATKPSLARALAGPLDSEAGMIGRLDAGTFRRTMLRARTVEPPIWMLDRLKAGSRPPELSWIRFPNFDFAPEEKRLLEWYQPQGVQTFRHGAYALEVVNYRLR